MNKYVDRVRFVRASHSGAYGDSWVKYYQRPTIEGLVRWVKNRGVILLEIGEPGEEKIYTREEFLAEFDK